jgi:cytochrome c553
MRQHSANRNHLRSGGPMSQMSLMRAARCAIALVCVLLVASPCLAARKRPQVPTEAGEKIYLEGVLSTGAPLRGERASEPPVQGTAAACANCHRRSGLGELEGRTLVPPTTAKYLYRPRSRDRPSTLQSAALTMAEPGARPQVLQLSERAAYTDATLARAIREGVGPDGLALDYLMPRFRIDDADMASLIAYLKQLSNRPSPGVGEETLQFATIITPEADPVRRTGMLDVLVHFFGKENVFPDDKGLPRQLSRRFTRIARRWQLHVWQLTGAPQSWEAQLDERLERQPVFAVISGVGGRTWQPVHRFCERSGLPCLFPNVDLPVDAEQDFYDVYFSRGVLLEAQLIAERLKTPSIADQPASARPRRVVQVYRRGDIGENAAAELQRELAQAGKGAAGESERGTTQESPLQTVARVLEPGAAPPRLQQVLSTVGTGDVLVLWLRAPDIEALPEQPPAAAGVFMSGILGGLEHAPLGAHWRPVTRMAYPIDLPQLRFARMDYAMGWMRFKRIPVVDARTQTDTYVACLATAETVSMLGEDLVRDHLLETLEMHLGTRLANGYYPRLSLAPGQRFASKGGFLVQFADRQEPSLVADGDWTVP